MSIPLYIPINMNTKKINTITFIQGMWINSYDDIF